VVDGRGERALRDAGIEVRSDAAPDAARRLNAAYVHHVTTGRPYVRWKVGATLDGKVAARDGSSRWITSEHARRDAHLLRAWADAIVIGAGTAVTDAPSLTVRLPGSRARSPLRVIVDASGRVRPQGSLFDGSAPTYVATTDRSDPAMRDAWRSAGAEVAVFDPDRNARVDPVALVTDLGKRDVQGVCLEGGPTLAWSFVDAGLVGEVVAYVAPKLLGGTEAPGILGGDGVASIAEAIDLRFAAVERVGDDLRVEAHVHRDR
jgi:diaminohydroxyphosphoribosylaminopyrimidine deaminase/5-amino-6-(5-phosphoribosylamino)uracil reductase